MPRSGPAPNKAFDVSPGTRKSIEKLEKETDYPQTWYMLACNNLQQLPGTCACIQINKKCIEVKYHI
jgi:hypothetical protein